jgi:hypothetical protein
MTSIQPVISPFDSIRQQRPDGSEYWSARDLAHVLGYAKWERFADTMFRARCACDNAGQDSDQHFPSAGRMVDIGSGAQRTVRDFELTRYACYLTAMNGDPRKTEIANAQFYFAARTREAELQQSRPQLSDDPVLAQLQVMLQMRSEHLTLFNEVRVISARLDNSPILGAQLGTIFRLGQQLGSRMESYPHAWRIFKDRYHLASYRDLPQSQYDDAVQFLKMQLASYPDQPAQQTLGLSTHLDDEGSMHD